MVILCHQVKAMNGKYESLDGHPKEKEKEIVGVIFWELKSIYSRLWCFQLSLVALNFGEVTWKSLTRRFLRRHEDSYDAHVKVHSLTTYHNLLAKFGKLPTDLYALKLTKGFQQRFTPPPSRWVIQASHSPNTLPNKNLTPRTNWQPCGRHHGGSIPWGNHNKPSSFEIDDLKATFLTREWNSFHLLGKRLDYLHLKGFFSNANVKCTQSNPSTPPQCKIIVGLPHLKP